MHIYKSNLVYEVSQQVICKDLTFTMVGTTDLKGITFSSIYSWIQTPKENSQLFVHIHKSNLVYDVWQQVICKDKPWTMGDATDAKEITLSSIYSWTQTPKENSQLFVHIHKSNLVYVK